MTPAQLGRPRRALHDEVGPSLPERSFRWCSRMLVPRPHASNFSENQNTARSFSSSNLFAVCSVSGHGSAPWLIDSRIAETMLNDDDPHPSFQDPQSGTGVHRGRHPPGHLFLLQLRHRRLRRRLAALRRLLPGAALHRERHRARGARSRARRHRRRRKWMGVKCGC